MCMQVTVASGLVTNMAETRQTDGADARIVVAHQVNDGVALDGFHLFLFKEQLSPDVALTSRPLRVTRDVNMLIELASVGMGVQDIPTSMPCWYA